MGGGPNYPIRRVGHPEQEQEERRAGNPVFPGWYADPDARIFAGQYWIYPSVSAAYEDQTYFDAFSSYDLTSWKKHSRILDFASIPWSTNRAAWAPTVAYKNGAYYMYFSAGDGAGIGVAKSVTGPGGPFVDVLGKPLIPDVKFGAEPIDPDIFIDDDGRNYLYYGGWSHGVVVELEDDMITTKGEFKEVTPPDYVEAPFMVKKNGVYYYMYSVGGWGDDSYGVSYVTGTSPKGPFSTTATKILTGNDSVGTGAGSHSVFRVGHDYYISYHRRYLNDTARDHRVVCIDRMYFNEKGEIEPVILTIEGVAARPLL
ncbi:CAZyme family GH43 [Paecilomyces variotii]|nr:CAZyme family GH43 [Paecilomyces variotii]